MELYPNDKTSGGKQRWRNLSSEVPKKKGKSSLRGNFSRMPKKKGKK
jgi:hypothetical protein